MIDRKLFQETFSTLHASPDTLSEVYKVVRKEPKHHHPISKGVLIAAVLAMCITVAAATGIANLIKANVTAADGITAADLHAFSSDSIGSDTPIITDNSGQVLNLPRMERVSTDAATMQRLVGDYLSTVDATVEAEGYTISLETFLIDENGSGFLTYTLSNPDGVTYEEAGYGQVTTPMNPVLYISEVDGLAMDANTYLDTVVSTDTALHLVLYFSDFGHWQKGDDLLFVVNNWNDADRRAISITPRAYLPVTVFTDAAGDTLRLSALGIRVDAPAASMGKTSEVRITELALHMTDGSEYVVESESANIMNWVIGLLSINDDGACTGNGYSFNRLVDVDAVRSITAEGHYSAGPHFDNAINFSSTYTQ